MLRLLQLLIVFSVSAFTELMAADLGQLQTSFMARYDEANAERDQGLKKLETSYLGALARHLDKVKASGKLERVIPVRDEISAVETGADPLPELPNKADRDLKKLRETYLAARTKVCENHAKTLTDLADKMNAALESEETDLTKAGKIDEALAAKRMRETLASDKGIAAARDLLSDGVRVPAFGAWTNLLNAETKQEGKERYFAGRMDRIPPGSRVFEPLRKILEARREKPAEILMAHAPARFVFALDDPIQEIRGATFLANAGGDVVFRIFSGERKVFERAVLQANDEAFEARFPPTRNITLEIDSNGSVQQDWCAWLKPEVR